MKSDQILLVHGKTPLLHETAVLEMPLYESAHAEIKGSFSEPWQNEVLICEPVSMPAHECLLAIPELPNPPAYLFAIEKNMICADKLPLRRTP